MTGFVRWVVNPYPLIDPMRTLYFLFALIVGSGLFAQATVRDTTPVQHRSIFRSSERYAVNPLVSIPLAAAMGYEGQRRLRSLQDKPDIPIDEVVALRKEDVNGFDRIALNRNHAKHKQALINSDYLFSAGQFAPAGLFLWKKYRGDWFDITLMYLEAQATQGMFYGYAPFGPTAVDRYRPLVYYTETGPETRNDGNQRNSMFSGHVSTMSTGFYFTARMIDDYNPQFTGRQRALLYVGATLPSLAGGWFRIAGLKHYPSDVLIGLGVGAISGIGVPSIHKWWKARHRSRLSAMPIYGAGAGGLSLTLRY